MIKQCVYGNLNNDTPARYYYKHGLLVLNEPVYKKFSPMAQKFIVYHEFAHAAGIVDENQADAWAFEQLVKGDHSLKATIEATVKALPFNSPEGRARIIAQFNRAAKYDREINGNQKINEIMNNPQNIVEPYAASMMAAGEQYDFLGLGKKAQARREERQELRAEKKAAKTDIKKGKADINKAKAEAIKAGTFQSTGSQIVGKVADIGKKFLGIQDPQSAADVAEKSDSESDQPTPKKNYTWVYILVAVVLLIVAYFAFFNKKGKKK